LRLSLFVSLRALLLGFTLLTASAAPTFAAEKGKPVPPPVATQPGQAVADLALQYEGAPYVWGGTSPQGFDCTGFVQWVYGQFDVALPRTEAGQLGSGVPVSQDALQPGDVVVFANTYRAGLSHTGIYVGDGRFIHAVDERHGVMVSDIGDSYWTPRLVGASRPLAEAGE
jgi:cell wall-associated NlpC family hydrolase